MLASQLPIEYMYLDHSDRTIIYNNIVDYDNNPDYKANRPPHSLSMENRQFESNH